MSVYDSNYSIEGPLLLRPTCTLLAKISWGEGRTGASSTPGDYTVKVWDYRANRGVGVRSTNDPASALHDLGMQLIVHYNLEDREACMADIVESTRVLIEKIPEAVSRGFGTAIKTNNPTVFGNMSIIQTQPKESV